MTEESHLCDMNPFCLGKAGTATSAMSEKVRTRLEELDDFEEVSKSPAAWCCRFFCQGTSVLVAAD